MNEQNTATQLIRGNLYDFGISVQDFTEASLSDDVGYPVSGDQIAKGKVRAAK